MLQMKAHCETCGVPLPPPSGLAFICSYECTFCEACAYGTLGSACPNCGGRLLRRPPRQEVSEPPLR